MKLIAKVNFQDVDGNSIQKTYNHGCDLYGLIDSMNYSITDKDNFKRFVIRLKTYTQCMKLPDSPQNIWHQIIQVEDFLTLM